MHTIRAGGSRPLARVGAVATPLAVIAMLVLPNTAFAATTIGSTPTTPPTSTCSLGFDFVQASTGSTSTSYLVPTGGGVITDWTTMTGPSVGQIGLEVWRLATAPATYTLVGASPLVTPLAINTLTTSTLATPIPVLAGDLLGLRLEGPATCFQAGSAGDTLGYFMGPNPALLSTETMNVYPSAALLNVSATVGAIVPPPPPPPPPPPTGCDQNGDQTGDQTAQMPDRSNNDHVSDASTVDQSGGQTGDHASSWSGDQTASSRGDWTGDSTGDSNSGDQTGGQNSGDACNQGTTAD